MRLASASGQNLTLSDLDLSTCRPVTGEGGRSLRAFCPYHGSDHQRSLRIDIESGRFHCFSCGAWGYTEEARRRWREERARSNHLRPHPRSPAPSPRPPAAPQPTAPSRPRSPPPPPPAFSPADLAGFLQSYQRALPDSPGEHYLRRRGIPLELAQRHGLGYAPPGQWAHRGRDWNSGRLVFPHTAPDGTLVSLYGRAVGFDEVPKALRHDHLPGAKGYFNARALCDGTGALFVCEGPFDALSLIAAGQPRALAIFGVHGWRWEWARDVRELVFAFDADQAGENWRQLARQAYLRGRRVAFLTAADYGGRKDVNEAWTAGTLCVSHFSEAPAVNDPAGGCPRPDLP